MRQLEGKKLNKMDAKSEKFNGFSKNSNFMKKFQNLKINDFFDEKSE